MRFMQFRKMLWVNKTSLNSIIRKDLASILKSCKGQEQPNKVKGQVEGFISGNFKSQLYLVLLVRCKILTWHPFAQLCLAKREIQLVLDLNLSTL